MICYGHADLIRDALGRRGPGRGHDVVFTDSRTGRSFCHECVVALVTWELDGCPEPGEFPYPEWIGSDEDEERVTTYHLHYEDPSPDEAAWVIRYVDAAWERDGGDNRIAVTSTPGADDVENAQAWATTALATHGVNVNDWATPDVQDGWRHEFVAIEAR